MKSSAQNFSMLRRSHCATSSASLRSLTLRMGQSGSFALPIFVAALLCLITLTGISADTNALAKLQNVHRIVFLGDSITYAGQYVEDVAAYYATRFPNEHFEFINVGLSSETVSGLSEEGHAGGRYRRPDLHERLGRILEKTKPDLTFVCYGMNDGIYQPIDDARLKAFQEGMKSVHEQIAATGAKIIHLTPPVFDPVPIKEKLSTNGAAGFSHPYEGYNQVLDRYSEWLMAQRSAGWDVADLHSAMNRWLAEQRQRNPNFSYTKDGVHPDANGHWLMAKQILLHLGAKDVENADSPAAMMASNPHSDEILKLIREKEQLLRDAWLTATGHKRPGVKDGLPLPEAEAKAAELDVKIRALTKTTALENPPSVFPGTTTNWQGFERHDFEFNHHPAIVVVPPHPLPGNPWAWRGEFFGAYANADAELVAKGFHLAYLRVPDLFGSPDAVKYWNEFYAELTGKYGFAKKVALIGLSRGGLYCYNWAIANPEKVACIYADAPVCDFKSWPGRHGQAPAKDDKSFDQWQKMLAAYHFTSDAEALAYGGNPVDNLKPLAQAKVPLLHVYGDADTVVPWMENTAVVAERYQQLGGTITLIPKPGVDHHPHGLTNPAPIVDFILKYAATNT
jgi:lysophospholipase L1-like esterase/pimeloyl-ACP methyl ester carboxylesterase